MRLLVLSLVFSLFFVFNVHAERAHMIYGIGGESCGSFLSNIKTKQGEYAFQTWIGGFVTGFNVGNREGLVASDLDAFTSWIINYCNANPLDNVATAAVKLGAELERRSQTN